MTPRVVACGPLVPAGPSTGVVVHASASAVYVAWASRDLLTAVHDDRHGRSPWSVTLAGIGPLDAWARCGEVAAARAGRLRVGRLVVGLGPRGEPAPRPLVNRPSWDLATAHRTLRTLAPDAVSAALARAGIAGPRWWDRAERLVGRGPGLTPSGDDVLTGALCAFGRYGAQGVQTRLVAVAQEAAPRTTAVGAHQLRAAARGWFVDALVGVVDAEDPDSLARAVPVLLGIGATSGADLLAGVVLALDALATTREPVP